MEPQFLEGIKVLDLSWYISGPWCTKLLADFGADVLKVERPPDGEPTRRVGPFLNDQPHPEKSLLFSYLNLNKRSITLNLKSHRGKEIFMRLVKDMDVLVESFSPGVMERLGFGYEDLKKNNPNLIMLRISNFGQTGPYRDMKASELTFNGMGHAQVGVGVPGRYPLKMGGNSCQYQAGNMAFLSVLSALWARDGQGVGQCIDMAIGEALLCGGDRAGAIAHTWAYSGRSYFPKSDPRSEARCILPWGFYPCKDGRFLRMMATIVHWPRFVKLMGMPELEERFSYPDDILDIDRKWEIDEIWYRWCAERDAREAMEACQDAKLFATMVATPQDVVRDPHFRSRGFWVDVEHPMTGMKTYPGAPSIREGWKMKRPAPMLRQHNTEVYCNELGYSPDDLVKFKGENVI